MVLSLRPHLARRFENLKVLEREGIWFVPLPILPEDFLCGFAKGMLLDVEVSRVGNSSVKEDR
ncbi:MAG: hypothetical protein AUH86_12300 [Acidobacteria bacterium 13_1_40CM_4_58_4]|nr:MAG: hypothetical protein AUH86_12300 [Acidobacteria bacterium 13_1_40CM_4_58_4]